MTTPTKDNDDLNISPLTNSIPVYTRGPSQRCLECQQSTVDPEFNGFTLELALQVLRLQSRATEILDRDATGEDWAALLHDIEHLDKQKAYVCDHSLAYQDMSRHKLLVLRPTTTLLWERFTKSQKREDLDTWIKFEASLLQVFPDNHPDRPECLSRLGASCQYRFEWLKDLGDLNRAIEFREEAAMSTPLDHLDKPRRLDDVSISYRTLFESLGRLGDLEKSVSYMEQAVMLTPVCHPDRSGRLNSLGNSYRTLFNYQGMLGDIHQSVNCIEDAIMLAPGYHPDKPVWLHNLGTSYHSRFKRFLRLDDQHKSIICVEQAVLLTPDSHPRYTAHLCLLGNIYWSGFMHSRLLEDALTAMNLYKRAAILPTGPPSLRLHSSYLWANLSSHVGLSSLKAYTNCMALLPQVVWLGTPAYQLYKCLAYNDIGNLVTKAAAAAISMQRLDRAMEWLEQGRAVFWDQVLQLRLPYDELYAVAPETAQELQYVLYQLGRVSTLQLDLHPSAHDGRPSHEHFRLFARREELLESARLLPGLEDFLRPPKASKLIGLIQDGVAVVVNVHDDRCDALIIQAGTQAITHVSLVGFTTRKAEDARHELSACFMPHGRGFKEGNISRQPNFYDILAMLWYDIAKPVLNHLGIVHVLSADELPHITWCTTGPLSFLPLHAAGDYNSPSTVLSNLAISSYVPKISLLGQRTSSPGKFSGILAVGHESSIRCLHPLPNVKAELDEVQLQAMSLPFTRLDEESACTGAVLAAMADHSWVHFACHASQDSLDPMKSALHLHDGDLDLTTISRNSFKNAEFAFLSACQTATGDPYLPDQSIHLAAGLLVAGYRSVIASMWALSDPDVLHVTAKVYECLLEGGIPDSRKAAKALHKAIGSLRDAIGVNEFARWVPYVHFGC